MVSRREPDDLCPSCGVPVPFARRREACPYCGHEFGLPVEGPETTGYLTTFGYGMCGLIAGGQIGLAFALTAENVALGDPRLVSFPVLGGCACACAAAGIGSRLDFRARRGFECLLLALVATGIVVLVLALAGVNSVDTLSAVAACALVVAAPLVWRFMYLRRPTR